VGESEQIPVDALELDPTHPSVKAPGESRSDSDGSSESVWEICLAS